MNKANSIIAQQPGLSKLVRARFGPGMLLQHEDLEQLNVYSQELSRLLFRSLFGCGVVCGLVVHPQPEKCGKVSVTVGAGLALDCSGRPVHVPEDQHLTLDADCDPELKGPLWVILSGTTKRCAPRMSMCPDDDDRTISVCTRERDTFEIRVVNAPPTCACACPEPEAGSEARASDDVCKCADSELPCYKDHYDGKSGCTCGDSANCDGQWVLLAKLSKDKAAKESPWRVDHRVRRFIRPVLMRDPQVAVEASTRSEPKEEQYLYAQAPSTEALSFLDSLAVDAARAADRAAEQAKAAQVTQTNRLAAVTAAKAAADKAKAAADKAKAAADKAQAAVDRNAEDEAARDRAVAEAARANEAAAAAERATLEAERATAEAEHAARAALAAEETMVRTIKEREAAERVLATARERTVARPKP